MVSTLLPQSPTGVGCASIREPLLSTNRRTWPRSNVPVKATEMIEKPRGNLVGSEFAFPDLKAQIISGMLYITLVVWIELRRVMNKFMQGKCVHSHTYLQWRDWVVHAVTMFLDREIQ